jgi:phosphate transport system substrate-binding protein
MVNLVQAWSEEFMKKYPEVFVAVTGGGSGTGFASLINGTCDIAVSSREIKTKEVDLAVKKGITPKEFKVALDGLAVVVSPKNPVSSLTLDQLADIFTGKIQNWKEVGGVDSHIVLLSREVNSGTHVYFKEHVLRKNKSDSVEEFSPEALLLPSSQAIADEIMQNSAAIGYYGMGYIGKDHKAIAVSKDAASPAVNPTIENVVTGAYPISRPLYIYSSGEAKGEVKQFIDYILSEEGQAIVPKVDFVPITK